jgi:hypothetical protein
MVKLGVYLVCQTQHWSSIYSEREATKDKKPGFKKFSRTV